MKDYCKNWVLTFQTSQELEAFVVDDILNQQATQKVDVKKINKEVQIVYHFWDKIFKSTLLKMLKDYKVTVEML